MNAATLTLTAAIPATGLVCYAPLPEMLSQVTVEALTGVDASRYLASLPLTGLPISKLGKLRLVDRAGYVAWLRSLASSTSSAANDAQEPDGADILLENLGFVDAPKRKKSR